MSVLIFAPHNDDEVLGVGGTAAKLSSTGEDVYICEVTSGPNFQTLQHEANLADKILGIKKRIFLELPYVELDIISKKEVNRLFSNVINTIKPNIVFLPHIGDIHTDHKETAKAALVAVRPYSAPFVKKVYSYETLSESEWENPTLNNCFNPNVWSDIENFMEFKIAAFSCYKSQIKEFPHPRSIEAIKALGKFRGSSAGFKYAEAFMLIRDMI